jgi:hypothetical protein
MSGPALAGFRADTREVATSIADYVAAGEASRRIPDEVYRILADSGCFGRTLPAGFGGSGAGLTAFAAQQEALASVWPTAAVAATWANLSGRLIDRFGTAEQRRHLLPGLVRGDGLGAVGWTEPHGGSDAAALRFWQVLSAFRLPSKQQIALDPLAVSKPGRLERPDLPRRTGLGPAQVAYPRAGTVGKARREEALQTGPEDLGIACRHAGRTWDFDGKFWSVRRSCVPCRSR